MREPKASEKVVVEVGERGPGRGGGKQDPAVDSPGLAADAKVLLSGIGEDGVPETPSRNEGVTTCQRCGRGFAPIGRQLLVLGSVPGRGMAPAPCSQGSGCAIASPRSTPQGHRLRVR